MNTGELPWKKSIVLLPMILGLSLSVISAWGAKPDLLGFALGMTSQVALVRAAALKLFVQDPPNGGRASVLNRRTASIGTNQP